MTRARKLEGQWWGDGGVYVVSSYARSDDGSLHEHDGQVWFFDPRKQTIRLTTIFAVNEDGAGVDGPDNITVSPHGGLVLAEDGEGASQLIGVTDQGTAYRLALNLVDDSVPGDAVMVRDKEFIFCPWHQWGFELATGTTAVKPEWSIRTYPVRVVGNDVLVQA